MRPFPFALQKQRMIMRRRQMNDLPSRDVVIFTEALELPADKRAAFVEGACAGDLKLRQKVEALLQTHDHVGNFLEEPPPQTKNRVIGLAATNCCNKSVKADAAWFTWRNKSSR